MEIRDELRKKSKEFYKIYGRDRYLVESLYGNVKQSVGGHFKVKLEDIAVKMALCTMILYNLDVAIVLGVIIGSSGLFFITVIWFLSNFYTRKLKYQK